MSDVHLGDFEPRQDGYVAPNCVVRGGARSALFHPVDYSLWQVVGTLEAGTELEWLPGHGDEALFVLNGAVDVDGVGILSSGTVFVEAGVPARLRATELTQVAHFGPADHEPPVTTAPGIPAASDRGTHVFSTARDASQIVFPDVTTSYFGDGSCPTCRIAFFEVDGTRATDGYTSPSHVHSEDEIIHVLEGELRVGQLAVTAGMSIAVAARRRYGFRTPGGYRFLNYRRATSFFTRAPGSEPFLETVEVLRAMAATSGDAHPAVD